MPTKRNLKTRKRDLRTIRKKWELVEKTKGGLGGNWIHSSYFHTKEQALKKASSARKDLGKVKNSLKKRHIKFNFDVLVKRRKK